MNIYKDIEIDSSDFKTNELIGELEERIESKFILCTDEHQNKMQPEVDAMVAKLTEIRQWLCGY